MAERSANEIRDFVLHNLDLALRASSWLGGVKTWNQQFDILCFIDDKKEQENAYFEDLIFGNKFPPTGISGAFDLVFGAHSADMVASVYAEFALRQGWLRPDRVLPGEEFDVVLAEGVAWCGTDRTLSDVTARFGAPSCRLGSDSPSYPCTLMFVSDEPDRRAVYFHLWNTFTRELPSEPVYRQPVLLGMRHMNGPFYDGFTLTPMGAAHQLIAEALRPEPELGDN